MTDAEVNTQFPTPPGGKNDSVVDLLASVEKIIMFKTEKSMTFLFNQLVSPANLRERFLFATIEIIGEKGAEALSASELIKKTKSSKGALFHHYETLDHLCIESLLFFTKQMAAGLPKEKAKSLEEFLNYIMKDSLKKQSTEYYFHLVNFFRDRAIRDERYRAPLKGLFEVNLNYYTDCIVEFLPASVSREVVFNKVLFMCLTIERVSIHRVLYQNPETNETELNEFLQNMLQSISALK